MPQTLPHMRISLAAMLGWVLPIWLVLVGGGWPLTAAIAGAGAWQSFLCAAFVALTVVLVSALLVMRAARRGPSRAAFTFVMTAMFRVLLGLAMAGAAWTMMNLDPVVLLVWVVVFQLALLVGEVIWLARALQRDAFLVALGEIRRQ